LDLKPEIAAEPGVILWEGQHERLRFPDVKELADWQFYLVRLLEALFGRNLKSLVVELEQGQVTIPHCPMHFAS
jgi:hypothetical protein